MEPRASRRRPAAASRRQPKASSDHLNPRSHEGEGDRPPTGARQGGGIAIALFSEPCRGTHGEKAPVMLLGVKVGADEEPTLLGVDASGQPRWFTFPEVTFDWRWSTELGRWADLEELVNPQAL
jgi:hypothetical protein